LWDVRGDVARQALECLQVREALECHAVARAAHAPSRDLTEARAIAASMNDCPSLDEWYELDVQFHRAVHDVGGNTVLADYAERLQREALANLSPSGVSSAVTAAWLDEHAELLEAIEAGDAAAAVALARAHVRHLLSALTAAQH
jgi:GntR family transcriptional repressor for pyruvate dehydrogenase complex